MEERSKVKYGLWMFFNIFLPLLPVVIKLVITLMDNRVESSFEVLDSSELLYYNFVICISITRDLLVKHTGQIRDLILCMIMPLIMLVDIILLVLYYENIEAKLPLKVVSIILSVLVPVVVCRYHLKTEQ